MPNDAKKSPKPQKSGKKLNAINSVPPQMQKAKNKYQKKPETRKSQQKINIEVSVSCGLARTEENCVVQVVGQQLIATNRCTKLQIAFPAWRGSHAFPPVSPISENLRFFPLLFYDCLASYPNKNGKGTPHPLFFSRVLWQPN